MRLADALRRARDAAGLTQEQAADRVRRALGLASFAAATISAYEIGRVLPSTRVLSALAMAYGQPSDSAWQDLRSRAEFARARSRWQTRWRRPPGARLEKTATAEAGEGAGLEVTRPRGPGDADAEEAHPAGPSSARPHVERLLRADPRALFRPLTLPETPSQPEVVRVLRQLLQRQDELAFTVADLRDEVRARLAVLERRTSGRPS
jgi:transcriptional regulator with XRE-family HTH domain